jgi:predicted HAD superfamily Cof-like phosphohydrolase
MKNILKKVKEFQKAFDAPTANKPRLLSFHRCRLRFDLMEEENKEYLEACDASNIVEVADALGDMLYILAGTIIEHGLPHIIEDVFNEIHESNMSKLDADGKPIINGDNNVYDPTRPLGKVLKSKMYFKPDIASVLDAGKEKTIEREISLRKFISDLERKKANNEVSKDLANSMIATTLDEINYITK